MKRINPLGVIIAGILTVFFADSSRAGIIIPDSVKDGNRQGQDHSNTQQIAVFLFGKDNSETSEFKEKLKKDNITFFFEDTNEGWGKSKALSLYINNTKPAERKNPVPLIVYINDENIHVGSDYDTFLTTYVNAAKNHQKHPVNARPVIFYGSVKCGNCFSFAWKMNNENIQYIFYNVYDDSNANMEMWKILREADMAEGTVTFPVIKIDNQRLHTGANYDNFLKKLRQSRVMK